MSGLFDAVAMLGIHDPSESKNPDILCLYNFWLGKRDANGWFNFRDFDVLDIPPHFISKVSLTKVHSGGKRFEIRVVGGDIIINSGINATGRFLDALPGAELSQKRSEFCVKHNMPYAADGTLTWGQHSFKHYSIATVPLHDDSGNVEYLLSVMSIHSEQPAESTASQLNISCSNLPSEDIATFNHAFEYWVRSRGNFRLPLKSEIDITQIPQVLPHLVLCEVLENPLDFRIKLIGEAVKVVVSPKNLGKCLREQPGNQPGTRIWEYYETVYQTGVPRYSRLEYNGPDRQISHVLNLLLPYSTDRSRTSHVLSIISPRPKL